MKIIQNFSQVELVKDTKMLTRFFNQQYAFVPAGVLEVLDTHLDSGNTVIVYSGGWRFNVEASYIEPDYMRNLEFNYPKFTYFIDNAKQDLLIKLANKFSNVVFIDSILTKYKTVDELNNFFMQFPKSVAVLNSNLIIYNRLTTTIEEIAKQVNGYVVGDFIIRDSKSQ